MEITKKSVGGKPVEYIKIFSDLLEKAIKSQESSFQTIGLLN